MSSAMNDLPQGSVVTLRTPIRGARTAFIDGPMQSVNGVSFYQIRMPGGSAAFPNTATVTPAGISSVFSTPLAHIHPALRAEITTSPPVAVSGGTMNPFARKYRSRIGADSNLDAAAARLQAMYATAQAAQAALASTQQMPTAAQQAPAVANITRSVTNRNALSLQAPQNFTTPHPTGTNDLLAASSSSPWWWVGGAAAVSLVIGIIIVTHKKKS